MEEYFVTPQKFGAAGDGAHDDTAAIRAAVEAAAQGCGTVFFPAGTYLTGAVRVPPAVCLRADTTWAIRSPGRTVLAPAGAEQDCIFDLTDALGVTLHGLCLDGRGLGTELHGLSMSREHLLPVGEHSLRIENCQIRNFSGDGMHMVGAWAVSVRGSHCFGNGGYGFYLDGCDAFIVDNWFSGNGRAGFGGDTWNSAVNFTSNRVEWNRECGISLTGGMRYNITGNYIDRSFGPAIVIKDAENYHKRLHRTHTVIPYAVTVTGNTIVRSGRAAAPGSDDDCHIFMKNAAGITVTANTFNVWKDDGPDGRVSPWYGIILESCSHCVIANNTMLPGAVKQLILDRGGHGGQVVIRDNVGAEIPASAQENTDPFTPVHFMSEGGEPWYAEKLAGEDNSPQAGE